MGSEENTASPFWRISRRNRRIIAGLIVFILAVCLLQTVFHPDRKADLIIVFAGGMQGHLDWTEGENLGYAGISAAVQEAEKDSDNVITVDMGDCLGGSEVAEADSGKSILDIMNTAGYDALVPGSLDFVYGNDTLASLQSSANFPFLAANITGANGETIFDDYKIMNINNVRIGLIGVTDAPGSTRADAERITIGDPSDTVNSVVRNMGGDVDCVVVLAHVSDSSEIEEIAADSNVDVVIQQAGSESSAQNTEDGTLITCSTQKGKDVGILKLSIDRGKVSASCSFEDTSDIKDPGTDSDTAQASAKAAQILEDKASEEVGSITLPEAPAAPESETDTEETEPAETVYAAETETSATDETSQETNISESSGDTQNSAGAASGSTSSASQDVSCNNYETTTGDFTADAMVYAGSSFGVKAALIRDRDISGELKDGKVTAGELNDLFEDDRYMVICSVTGGTLRSMLEDSFDGYPKAGNFLQVSGITYSYTSGTDIGSALSDIMIDLQVMEDGASYTIAVTDDIASDYGLLGRAGAKVICMRSMGSVLADYAASGNSSNSSDASQTESETSESQTYRINIQ